MPPHVHMLGTIIKLCHVQAKRGCRSAAAASGDKAVRAVHNYHDSLPPGPHQRRVHVNQRAGVPHA